MFNFFELEPDAFGLDFSDLCLRIAKLDKKQDGFMVSFYSETPLEPGIINNGDIRKEDELVKAIEKAIESVNGKSLDTKYVVASLPENKAFLEVIQMPLIPKEDLKSAVIYEAENHIPLPIEEVYLDSQIVIPIVDHLDHHDVLIAALPRKIVDPYVSVLKKAGLKPLALETESLSKVRALIKDETVNSPVAIIDIGKIKTSFIIFAGKSIRFSFYIPIALKELIESVSGNLRVDYNEAENLIREYGLEGKSDDGKKVFESMSFVLDNLVKQFKKYLDYYYTHNSHEHLPVSCQKIEKIILCGEEASLKGLSRYLSQRLETKVDLGDPWVNILDSKQRESLETSLEKSLSFTSALGLALRGERK